MATNLPNINIKRNGYVRPIPRDPVIEKLDKHSKGYRYRERRLTCITCFNQATQMLCFDLDGCKVIEQYCDLCLEKYHQP
jgi:hypothetical protein